MQMSDVTEPVLTETELEELKGRVAKGDTEAMVDLGMHYWDEGSDLKRLRLFCVRLPWRVMMWPWGF